MHISRLVIRNFRNFNQLDLKFESGITCLIGENNSGKTNLIHALRLVVDGQMSSQNRQLTEDDFHTGISPSKATQILISVEFKDYKNDPNQSALVGYWEIDDDRARLTYRFRPNQAVREDIESGERSDAELTIDDYHFRFRFCQVRVFTWRGAATPLRITRYRRFETLNRQRVGGTTGGGFSCSEPARSFDASRFAG
jgi:predicted ATP-dependent endonuclease of OLD family